MIRFQVFTDEENRGLELEESARHSSVHPRRRHTGLIGASPADAATGGQFGSILSEPAAENVTVPALIHSWSRGGRTEA